MANLKKSRILKIEITMQSKTMNVISSNEQNNYFLIENVIPTGANHWSNCFLTEDRTILTKKPKFGQFFNPKTGNSVVKNQKKLKF